MISTSDKNGIHHSVHEGYTIYLFDSECIVRQKLFLETRLLTDFTLEKFCKFGKSKSFGNFGWWSQDFFFNLLKPTGYVMHQQFNIQQF